MLTVRRIDRKDTLDFILNIHYAHRIPSISYAFGLFDTEQKGKNLFDDGELIGICTFGSPASPYLTRGIAGECNKGLVIELNRLCLKYNRKNEASFLVAKSLKLLPTPKIIVSYADTEQNHLGIVYQATNFLFTGTTKQRTDIDTGYKHSRHYEGIVDYSKRKNRSAKHRYVMFLGNKSEKRKMLKALKYPILPYPKHNNIEKEFTNG